MELDDLYISVTEAILYAETFEELESTEAKSAHARVSKIEEQIAAVTAVSSAEGILARRGAVRAALFAGDPNRAEDLAKQYGSELSISVPFRRQLRQLCLDGIPAGYQNRRSDSQVARLPHQPPASAVSELRSRGRSLGPLETLGVGHWFDQRRRTRINPDDN